MNDVLTELAVIWSPTIVAIICMIVSVFKCVANVKHTCDEFRQNNLSKKLDELIKRNDELVRENLTLKKQLNEVLDNMKRINGYAERKYRHDKDNKNEKTGHNQ